MSKEPVVVEESKEGLSVRLFDYGDADVLEDRLIEDHDVAPVLRRVEKKDGKREESFVLFFPEAKSRSVLQTIIDSIQ